MSPPNRTQVIDVQTFEPPQVSSNGRIWASFSSVNTSTMRAFSNVSKVAPTSATVRPPARSPRSMSRLRRVVRFMNRTFSVFGPSTASSSSLTFL